MKLSMVFSPTFQQPHVVNHVVSGIEKTVAILLDFSKAFDLISHSMLLAKLQKQFSFSVESISMIKSHLSDRRQFVDQNLHLLYDKFHSV